MNNNPLQIFQNFLNMGSNPQQVRQMILHQNPQLQVIENQMQQSGLSPVQFVMQYAQQNNMPIANINNMYQQMLGMVNKKQQRF